MSAPETAAATAPTEEVKPTEAPAPEVVSKDPVVRTLTAALRRVLTHAKPQEPPKEEPKAEVRVIRGFWLSTKFKIPSHTTGARSRC